MKQKFTLLLVTILTTVFVVNKSSAQITDLNAMKALYQSSTVVLPSATLSGVIISDTVNKNVSAATAVVEANGTAVVLYFGKGAGHVYNVGDSVNIDVTGDSLKLFNSYFEIVPVAGSKFPAPVAYNVPVTPTPITVYDLTNDVTKYAFLLVIIHHAAINTTTSTFSGSNNLADATGSMIVYTTTSSTFASNPPSTDTMDYIGYMNIYKAKTATTVTPEFTIRSTNDIQWALPLSFKAFAVETKGNTALLSWNTANEVNTSKFVIEKGLDGSSFAALNSVLSKGKAINSYSYSDASNKSGSTAYYRLKSIDKTGSFNYSNVQKVVFAASTKISAYPNPTFGTTRLSYTASTTDAIARILSVDGKVVKQVTLKAGTTTTDLQLAGISKGVYTVETGNTSARVIKN